MQHSSVGDDRAVRPRIGFRAAEGVRAAWVAASAPFSRTPTGHTRAQRSGLAYEAKVHAHLESTFADLYNPSLWFKYVDSGGRHRFCQPDGVLRLGNMVVIFEVKSRFTSDGWHQLRRLYAPVVQEAWRPSLLGLCLIVKSYDPFTVFPEQANLVTDLQRWVVARSFSSMGVFPWRP